MSIYKIAASSKLRFASSKGQLTVEDLFDLSLPNLDALAKTVRRELKYAEEEESFIETKSPENTVLELKLEILKDVIATKLEEKSFKEKALEIQRKKEVLLNLLDQKQYF